MKFCFYIFVKVLLAKDVFVVIYLYVNINAHTYKAQVLLHGCVACIGALVSCAE